MKDTDIDAEILNRKLKREASEKRVRIAAIAGGLVAILVFVAVIAIVLGRGKPRGSQRAIPSETPTAIAQPVDRSQDRRETGGKADANEGVVIKEWTELDGSKGQIIRVQGGQIHRSVNANGEVLTSMFWPGGGPK